MWQFIKSWFQQRSERQEFIAQFNFAARQAFIRGQAPTLIQARTTIGNSNYTHAFSKWAAGGFRMKVEAGEPLYEHHLVIIADIILGDQEIVRQMITLGWDTLEIHAAYSKHGLQWKLWDYGGMGKPIERF